MAGADVSPPASTSSSSLGTHAVACCTQSRGSARDYDREDEIERRVREVTAAVSAGKPVPGGALDLRGCHRAGLAVDAVTGAGRLIHLTCVNLEFALQVNDGHVAALATCGTLRRVNLNAAQNVGDDAVVALATSCPELEEIGLYWNVRVGFRDDRRAPPGTERTGRRERSSLDANPERFPRIISREPRDASVTLSVRLPCCVGLYPKVTDKAVTLLCASCPALRRVNLSGCKRLTDTSARALATLRHLEHLDVTRVKFSDAGLTDVVLSPTACDTLAHLNLYAVDTYTDRSFACIGVLSQLTFLDICGSQSVTDKALKEIAECRLLTYLNLSWCNQLTDEGLCKVAEGCKLLELISVHGNRNVTSRFVTVLARYNQGPRLTTLDVNGCVGVLEDKDELRAMIPSLTTFVYHT